ncbi:MAG: hypothetical protein MHPSP_002526, partial [Paramarteilia canceri]
DKLKTSDFNNKDKMKSIKNLLNSLNKTAPSIPSSDQGHGYTEKVKFCNDKNFKKIKKITDLVKRHPVLMPNKPPKKNTTLGPAFYRVENHNSLAKVKD